MSYKNTWASCKKPSINLQKIQKIGINTKQTMYKYQKDNAQKN